jgi:hypothetical protein
MSCGPIKDCKTGFCRKSLIASQHGQATYLADNKANEMTLGDYRDIHPRQ